MNTADSLASPASYLRRTDVNAVGMDGEVVMMGVDQGEYFGLREVAATIWEHLDEPRTLDELCTLVSAEYDVSPQGCRADVLGFVTALADKRLVDIRP